MSELRKDPIIDRWVIIAPERGARPRGFTPEPADEGGPLGCPLCEGNERMTPPEVFSIRDRGEPNQPGWYVRVVPNKFPVLGIEGDPSLRTTGLLQSMDGIGAHEIIIESPRHDDDLAFAAQEQVMRVIAAYQQRVEDLRRDPRFRQIIVFRNYRRAAGASLAHPHSQVIALPVIPQLVREQMAVGADYLAGQSRCIFCDLIKQELEAGSRTIGRTEHFALLAPYASRFAFGAAIYPLRHSHDLAAMTPAERADLALALRSLLTAFRSALFNPPYNMVCHTAPSLPTQGAVDPLASVLPQCFHWHIELMPRLTTLAGFERGTGLYINPVAPEEAATILRQQLPT